MPKNPMYSTANDKNFGKSRSTSDLDALYQVAIELADDNDEYNNFYPPYKKQKVPVQRPHVGRQIVIPVHKRGIVPKPGIVYSTVTVSEKLHDEEFQEYWINCFREVDKQLKSKSKKHPKED